MFFLMGAKAISLLRMGNERNQWHGTIAITTTKEDTTSAATTLTLGTNIARSNFDCGATQNKYPAKSYSKNYKEIIQRKLERTKLGDIVG